MCHIRGSLRGTHCRHQVIMVIAQKGNKIKRKKHKDTLEVYNIYIDYRYLHNPFPDEDDNTNELAFSSDNQLYAIIAGDKYTSLKDTKNSPN